MKVADPVTLVEPPIPTPPFTTNAPVLAFVELVVPLQTTYSLFVPNTIWFDAVILAP